MEYKMQHFEMEFWYFLSKKACPAANCYLKTKAVQ